MARILYFATLVDHLDKTTEDLTLPPEVTTVGELLALLRARGGQWAQWLVEDSVRITVDRQLAAPTTRITNQSEIGIIPTGGW